jgi:hypothetical protein
VVFGAVVCSVGGYWVPEKMELVLGFAASKPIESHIHGFCASGLYVVVYDSEGYTVVGLHGSWGLFVAHFCYCLAFWDGFACVDVECT